jgi:hypothetical protein
LRYVYSKQLVDFCPHVETRLRVIARNDTFDFLLSLLFLAIRRIYPWFERGHQLFDLFIARLTSGEEAWPVLSRISRNGLRCSWSRCSAFQLPSSDFRTTSSLAWTR